MNAMFLSDLLIAKKYLMPQVGLGIVVGIFMCIMMENIYVIAPAIAAMTPFSVAFTILAFDERGGWEQFRLALPLSRKHVITGRYTSFAVIAIVGFMTGIVATGLVIIAATLLPNVPQLAALMVNFSWQAIVLASIAGVAVIVVMLSVVLPMVARFGMTKAVRFAPLIIFFGVFFLFTAGGNSETPQFLANLASWVQTPEGTLGMVGIALAAAAALYAASCALSIKLYERREW